MPQVTEVTLVAKNTDTQLIQNLFAAIKFRVTKRERISFLRTEAGVLDPSQITTYFAPGIMDQFHLALNLQHLEVREFFDEIAPRYEKVIEYEKNQIAAEALLWMAIGACEGVPKRVLDFGCGTGIAAHSVQEVGCQYVGFDISPAMRSIAEERGLKVLDEDMFLVLKDSTFDVVLACYVLHLPVERRLIEKAWQTLSKTGVFASNFHKNVNLDKTLELFKNLGAASITVTESEFGDCLIAHK